MMASRWPFRFRPGLSGWVLLAYLVILWVAGGASRADVAGQVIVRMATTVGIVILLLGAPRPALRPVRMPAFLLAAATALVALQLVPLPFAIWQALPGRALMANFAIALDAGKHPWMPLSLDPAATTNALGALLAPVLVLTALAGMPASGRRWLLPTLVLLIAASGLFGLMQFSLGHFVNPLVNNTPWQVSGTFANRNHYALFLALGCVLAPAWALETQRLGWANALAMAWGLTLFFVMLLLVTGSRAGLLLGAIAIVIGLILTREAIQRRLRHAPRWLLPVMVFGAFGLVAGAVALSLGAGHAEALERLLAPGEGEDMRSRAFPTVMAMIRDYLPLGSGAGGFDTVFRIHEPFNLLKRTYFNHAHNDFLEIVLDTGLPGLALLVAAVGWWLSASARAWRAGPGKEHLLPKLGSAMLFLILIASVVDYPARTPLMMTMVTISAVWLSDRLTGHDPSALPAGNQHI